jgi:UDP-glucuronate decarboxylase
MTTQFAGKTALVAGGAGFIGSHLCARLLRDGMRVICLDNLTSGNFDSVGPLRADYDLQLIEHDIVDPLPKGLFADLVINLACPASPPLYQIDPVHTMMTNVVGTNHLLALAAKSGARFLQASTSEVYGDPAVHPQTEAYLGNVNPTGPRACYDEGKRAAETLCFDYLRQGRVDTRVARIFNTYGPLMRPTDGRVISNMVSQALTDRPITVYGDGTQTRSFCFVDDLLEGLLALARHPKPVPHPVNLGNPHETNMLDLAETVLHLTGASTKIVLLPLPKDDPKRRRPDITLARNLLGWKPKIPLSTGLRRTIDWMSGYGVALPVRAAVRRTAQKHGYPLSAVFAGD